MARCKHFTQRFRPERGKRWPQVELWRQQEVNRTEPAGVVEGKHMISCRQNEVVMLVGFFVSHALHLEPGLIAIAGGLIMAVVCGVDLHHALEKVEWASVFFFVGLFMLIGSLEHHAVFEQLGHTLLGLTGNDFALTVMLVMWFAAIASAIVDNIPLVIAMLPLLRTMIPVFGQQMGLLDDPEALRLQVEEPLYWALALGACLGGNGSLVGASANVVIAQIGHRNKHPITFLSFAKYGVPTMLVTLVVASIYVWLRYL